MKELLIYAGIGFAVLQTLLLMAVMAAAARPTPAFEPEYPAEPNEKFETIQREDDRELELVC